MRIVSTALAGLLIAVAAHAPAVTHAQVTQPPPTLVPAQPAPAQPAQPAPGAAPVTQVPPAPAAPVGVVPPTATPVAPVPLVPLLPRSFTAKTGLLFNTVRPERVLDFETVIGHLEAAMDASTDPGVRAQAMGWRVFKATEPGPNATVLYVFVVDPAIPGADYGLGRILADAYPEKIQEIWKLYQGSVTGGGSLLNLTPVEAPPAVPVAPLGAPAVDPAAAPAAGTPAALPTTATPAAPAAPVPTPPVLAP